MYRAKKEKLKSESRRKEAQKVQVTHEKAGMREKGRGNGLLPLPSRH
jgi:hypothetical protein